MKKLVIILLLIALLAACGGPGSSSENARVDGVDRAFFRQVDEEAGVVCWVYYGSADGVAMDCIPIGDTRLSVGR